MNWNFRVSDKPQILWTLHKAFPDYWVHKFGSMNVDLIHHPLIKPESILDRELKLKTEKILSEIENIIVTSSMGAQFGVNNFKSILESKTIHTFSLSANEFLTENNLQSIYYQNAQNCEELSRKIISSENGEKYIHLCSTISNKRDWDILTKKGIQIIQCPIYTPNPLPNEDGDPIRNLNWNNIFVVAFGSPSGIKGFINIFQKSDTAKKKLINKKLAVMGNTTATALSELLGLRAVIIPQKSTSTELCHSIYYQLNQEKVIYESAA